MVAAFLLCAALSANAQESVKEQNASPYEEQTKFTFVPAQIVNWGLGTDALVPADYDGDGKADIAVFRDGIWYLQRSRDGFTGIGFGFSTDKPVPNAFVP